MTRKCHYCHKFLPADANTKRLYCNPSCRAGWHQYGPRIPHAPLPPRKVVALRDCEMCGELTETRKYCTPCRETWFLCGHPKTLRNSVMHSANGYTYPRCRTCRRALSARRKSA